MKSSDKLASKCLLTLTDIEESQSLPGNYSIQNDEPEVRYMVVNDSDFKPISVEHQQSLVEQ